MGRHGKIKDDQHFRSFASNLEATISRYGHSSEEDLTRLQNQQIDELVRLETEFRHTLIKHPWGPSVYRSFITYICEERRNILAARPFFRERQKIFTDQISKVLKAKAEKSLYKFRFNYEFVLFVLSARRWHQNRAGSKIVVLAQRIRDLRTEIVEMNLPLAISRARIFWSRTPKSHLSYMDLVQITAMGLMNAIDKFVLPYSPAFRAMAIGRMIGNLIEQYSETLVHFYPVDKRKIYRANKLSSRFGDNYEELAKAVNDGVEPQHRTDAAEIADLMAASSTVSSDTPTVSQDSEEEEPHMIRGFRADESTHPDVRYEQAEALAVLGKGVQELALVERKLLRMRGVSL